MKYYSAKTIPARLIQAEESINNGQASEVIDVLNQQGYTPEEFSVGAEYLAAVRSIDADRREQLGAQIVATAGVQAAYVELRKSFSADRRMMRQALSGKPEYIDMLRLKGPVSNRVESLVLQARHLYEKVIEHEAVMALLQSRYNITADVLTSRFQEIVALETAIQEQQYLKGQLREVSKQRQEAMARLDGWMRRFIAVSRIAFEDDRPKLEKLGIYTKPRK